MPAPAGVYPREGGGEGRLRRASTLKNHQNKSFKAWTPACAGVTVHAFRMSYFIRPLVLVVAGEGVHSPNSSPPSPFELRWTRFLQGPAGALAKAGKRRESLSRKRRRPPWFFLPYPPLTPPKGRGSMNVMAGSRKCSGAALFFRHFPPFIDSLRQDCQSDARRSLDLSGYSYLSISGTSVADTNAASGLMAGRQWRMSKASRLKGHCNRLIAIN